MAISRSLLNNLLVVAVCLLTLTGCKPEDVKVRRTAETDSSVTEIRTTDYGKWRPEKVEYPFQVPLKWADETELSVEIRKQSDKVISRFKELKQVELECNEAAISWLSNYIDEHRDGWSPEMAARLAESLGCFLGESIRSQQGGDWKRTEDDIQLSTTDDRNIFPFKMIREHLEFGSKRSIQNSYEAL